MMGICNSNYRKNKNEKQRYLYKKNNEIMIINGMEISVSDLGIEP